MPSNIEMLFTKEITAYEMKKSQLLAEHLGKYALVHESDVIGVFDTEMNALQAGYQRFGPIPLFIQQIIPAQPQQSAPALTLGILAPV
jgi:hypothetical protein